MKLLPVTIIALGIMTGSASAQVVADTQIGNTTESDYSIGLSADVPSLDACLRFAKNRTRAFWHDSRTLCSSKTGEILAVYQCNLERETWNPTAPKIVNCVERK